MSDTPVMCCIQTLPPRLQLAAEFCLGAVTRLNDDLSRMETSLAARPDDEQLQAKWGKQVALLSGLNELIQLLDLPVVRVIANERARQVARVHQAAAAQADAAHN